MADDVPSATLDSVKVEARTLTPSDNTAPISWAQQYHGQVKASINDTDQYLRKINLSVFGTTGGGQGKDLTGWGPSPQGQGGAPISLTIDFRVKRTVLQSVNLLYARVYNLSPQTMDEVTEYKRVSLSAGYRTGRYAEIFRGTVVQYIRGKENPTDTYLDIYAGDADTALNSNVIAQTFEKSTTVKAIIEGMAKRYTGYNQEIGEPYVDIDDTFGSQKILRAYSAMGMLSERIREWALAANADHFIDMGRPIVLGRKKYMPGETVVLNPNTGLIGMPEVTAQGIQIRCLLNPLLGVGSLVKLETSLISGVPYAPGQSGVNPLPGIPLEQRKPEATFGQQISSAFTSPTGTYKIMMLEHNGNIRGNPWYTDMVCIALDQTGQAIFTPDTPFNRAGIGSLTGNVTTPQGGNETFPGVPDSSVSGGP